MPAGAQSQAEEQGLELASAGASDGRLLDGKVALIFPGEQNQYVCMLQSCVHLPLVQEMLELASEAFGFDVEKMMLGGPAKEMARTDRSQMLVYVADCVAYELLKQEHPAAAKWPQCVAGFSVGEYAALVAAEVMAYDQGLIIVKARADAMQRWVEVQDMAAVGVFGPPHRDVADLCREATALDARLGVEDPQVHVSHFWGTPTGCVCAGRRSTVARLQELAEGSDSVFLHVLENTLDAGNTPMANCVAEEVAEAILSIPLDPPRCDVYFGNGCRVRAGGSPEAVLECMLQQLAAPLHWDRTVLGCLHDGVEAFYECGPKRSLRNLMKFNEYADVRATRKPYDLTTSVEV